jgi:DNA-binding NarL/FixJ family response regulator
MLSAKKINIAIIDDHPLFLEGIISLFKENEEIHIAGSALNAAGILEILRKNKVDVLICDISMPGVNGMELSQHVKKIYPKIGILILTMHEEQRIIKNMLKVGVNGYLFKNSNKELLLDSIKKIADGSQFISNEVKGRLESDITKAGQRPLIPKLSDREKEVLVLVSKEFTTQEIADELFISHHTVLSHRKKLLYKFEVNNTAGLIKKAIETGLLD